MGLGAHFFPLLFSLCLGVEIFWWLGFSGLGFSGGVWVDGSLGFGLGVVVEPWVCRGSWESTGKKKKKKRKEKENEERKKSLNKIIKILF